MINKIFAYFEAHAFALFLFSIKYLINFLILVRTKNNLLKTFNNKLICYFNFC